MTTATPTSRLRAEKIELRYADRTIVDELSLEIPDGGFTVVVGPNGCGKSTLLRALGRMLTPRSGRVVLDGNDIRSYRTKEVARRIALLPQSPLSPGAISVADLVSRGRYPYQSMLRQWSPEDEHVVSEALNEVGMRYAADQLVDELSGGQRQRVWIAMTLAQRTPVLLLDEPTTFLDIAHQIEVLDLCSQLHQSGRTLVAVLHDLNLAARYATHVVAMRSGKIVMQGSASDVFTPELLREVFDLEALVLEDPETGRPLVVPRDRRPVRQLPVHN
ncbi:MULTISPECIES: ABC transporter ATP-binding protein [Rhodococcus]|uniref:ABC transporter ATP-binding protein n=1 Tax=Rhodococcus TaxID=1827 RepID=UPI0004C46856|nr:MULTISPECIES: ABC transporter ATP-binding protein [Rhodococcus]MCJ0897939.1 ABC transporter ATP-binding protein [Rhodococcus sp. ARC_M13]OFE05689.1 iron-dicitrate transporter ATP-binding subunit [Rhodococcus sp. 1139]UKO86282.1 ABC transporter ATP-binding protein [Rhodococcus erythropolis]BBE48653.1 ABC transporter [Rhodococcus erythropolis]